MEILPADIFCLIAKYSVCPSNRLSTWAVKLFDLDPAQIVNDPKYFACLVKNPSSLDLILKHKTPTIQDLIAHSDSRAIDLLAKSPAISSALELIPKLLERHDASKIINMLYKTNPEQFINYMRENILPNKYYTSGSCSDLIVQRVPIYPDTLSLEISANPASEVIELFAKSFEPRIWTMSVYYNLAKNPNPLALSLMKNNLRLTDLEPNIVTERILSIIYGLITNSTDFESELLKNIIYLVPSSTILSIMFSNSSYNKIIFDNTSDFMIDYFASECTEIFQQLSCTSKQLESYAANKNPRAVKIFFSIASRCRASKVISPFDSSSDSDDDSGEETPKKPPYWTNYAKKLAANPGAIEQIKENPQVFSLKTCPEILSNPAIFTKRKSTQLTKIVANLLFNL